MWKITQTSWLAHRRVMNKRRPSQSTAAPASVEKRTGSKREKKWRNEVPVVLEIVSSSAAHLAVKLQAHCKQYIDLCRERKKSRKKSEETQPAIDRREKKSPE